MTKYNLLGRMCYRLWCIRTNSWKYVPISEWRRMSHAQRANYRTSSPYMPGWLKGGGLRAR